jgi:hypothetical protein
MTREWGVFYQLIEPFGGSLLGRESQSNELTRALPELVQNFRLFWKFTLANCSAHDPKFIWFGYITRLYQWGEGG